MVMLVLALCGMVWGEEGGQLLEQCKDVDGTLHKLEDSYIGPDGCNKCKCMQGGSACTKRLCPENLSSREAEANMCVDNKGVLHDEGTSYTHVDGCNTCQCTGGGGACTKRFCLSEATCEGGTKTNGDSWLHKDGCNRCKCSIFGTVCTEKQCALLQPELGADVAEVGATACRDGEGVERAAGEDWLTQDSCNICQCTGDSSVPSCTKMGCRVRLERLRQSSVELAGSSSAVLLPSLLLALLSAFL